VNVYLRVQLIYLTTSSIHFHQNKKVFKILRNDILVNMEDIMESYDSTFQVKNFIADVMKEKVEVEAPFGY